jgi:hypothetical protein
VQSSCCAVNRNCFHTALPTRNTSIYL